LLTYSEEDFPRDVKAKRGGAETSLLEKGKGEVSSRAF